MEYDVIIIGAGPAGLSAGIFTARAGLKTVCFEKLVVGGQAASSYKIANYPGFENISGPDLTEKMLNHAKGCGVEVFMEGVEKAKKIRGGFEVKTTQKTYQCEKLIIASGCKPRKLEIKNEQDYIGKGISYCASCDGALFKNKDVVVLGGGKTAFENVEYLSPIVNKVWLINRSSKFRVDPIDVVKTRKLKNVKILTNTQVTAVNGNKVVEEITLKDKTKTKTLAVQGVFVAIGFQPDLDFVNFNLELDEKGYILVDDNQQTNVKNVFACGDVTSKKFKQVITACADGARAGNSCIGG